MLRFAVLTPEATTKALFATVSIDASYLIIEEVVSIVASDPLVSAPAGPLDFIRTDRTTVAP